MSLVSLKCKNCGSGVTYNDDSQMITCSHCGNTFMLSELLDEKDLNFIKANKEINIENKLEIGNLLKQAETLIYKAEYRQAEEIFKKVVELDGKNYKGYYGIVKAKTHNFNKVPENEDYNEYAKLALKYVDIDDYSLIKSEIDKLSLLKNEQKIKRQELLNKEKQKKINEEIRRTNDNFFTKLTCLLIIVIALILIVAVVFTGTKTNNPNTSNESTYEVSTANELLSVLNKSNGMSATIIIKNDLDFSNEDLSPIGTKQKPFSGKIYGNGHTISNFNIVISNDEGESYAGLFGYIKDAYIYKIKLDNVDLISTKTIEHITTHNLGFICGYAENSAIKYCEISNSCKLEINHTNKSMVTIGGIVGKLINSTVSNANSKATLNISCLDVNISNVNINYYIGGVVGYFNSSNIIQSSSSSNIECQISSESEETIQTFVGGVIGYNIETNQSNKYIKNCYFNGQISSITTATNKHEYIAGIVAYGANQNSLQNNIVLNINSFNLNNTPADVSTFFDYSESDNICKYYTNEDAFNIKLEILINSAI